MTDRISLEELTDAVVNWFREHAGQFHLQAGEIEANYVLNWGGFVNASFTVTDGVIYYHLKLADDDDALAGLENWRDLHELLSKQFHAPKMLDWVEIPDTSFAGPIFEHIPGRPLDLVQQPAIRQEVMDFLAQLHSDQELASALSWEEDGPPTCGEYFMSVYIDRFDEDLRSVAADLPPFVSLDLLDWMMGETRELEGLARELPAFQHPAGAPTHGDLWSSNILVTGTGQWFVIDWDDLALGDPALEYAIFLGPLWRSHHYSIEQLFDLLPPEADLRLRFAFCLRAFLLDQVIDSLADWVECEFALEHQAQVRSEKARIHADALIMYRQMYP